MSIDIENTLELLEEQIKEEQREWVLDDLIQNADELWDRMVMHFGADNASRLLISSMHSAMKEKIIVPTKYNDNDELVVYDPFDLCDTDRLYILDGISLDLISQIERLSDA